MSAFYGRKVSRKVPQVPRASVRYLWHSGFYDRPLSGACLFNGERLWFIIFAEPRSHDKFVLLRLTDEQWGKIDFKQQLFRDYVGTHNDYDESGKRELGKAPLVEYNPDKFYGWAKENPECYEQPDGEQVAWFRNPCNMNG